MNFIKDEIIKVSRNHRIEFKEISADKFNFTRIKLEKKFCNKKKLFMWENFKDSFSVYNVYGWRLINKILNEEPVILFFNKDDFSSGFLFNSIKDIMMILSESIGFEFYLTNEYLDFILCFNHHDYLIATGSIISNLKKLVSEHII